MTPLEQLQHDHTVLRSKLALLENALHVGPDAIFAIRELIYTIGQRLAEHEQRENMALDPVLHETLADPRRRETQQLEAEHETIKYYLHALQLLTVKGSRMPLERVAKFTREFIEIVQAHFAWEEQVLFPILARLEADRAANAQAKATHPQGVAMDETMTVNRVISMFPETRRVFECHCVDYAREGMDFLDEVAWRHGVTTYELLRELRHVARLERRDEEEAEPLIFG